MTKIRTFKKHTVVYGIEKYHSGFVMSIEKSSNEGIEKCAYFVNGEEKELKALLVRMWKCGVTPTSFVYILEDEGYIPSEKENAVIYDENEPHIIRRKNSCVGEKINGLFDLGDSTTPVAIGCTED